MSGSAGATTLSTPQIPSHSHPNGTGQTGNFTQGSYSAIATSENTGAAGGGGSHTHPFSFSSGAGTVNLSVKYVDLIIAEKN